MNRGVDQVYAAGSSSLLGEIGEGATIGADTVEPLSICRGLPFRALRHRDKEHDFRLKREGKFGGPSGRRFEPCPSPRSPQL